MQKEAAEYLIRVIEENKRIDSIVEREIIRLVTLFTLSKD
jgi:hypothetical protein